jgi:hypothetical protein
MYYAIRSKCYLANESLATFSDADSFCNEMGYGTEDAHLVQIANRPELYNVQKLCRGAR